MTDNKNLFITLEEKDLQMRIEMGDDGKYVLQVKVRLCFRGSMELLSP